MKRTFRVKRTLRRIIESAADRLGLVVVRWGMAPHLQLRDLLRELFAHYDVRCVLDVGANIGQYGFFLREQVGYTGAIHSFEPDLRCLERLRARAASDQPWFVHDCALGAEETTLELNLAAWPVFSSFLRPAGSYFHEAATIERRAAVAVRRLDALWADLEGVTGGGVYLKMDTQGFDLEVFRGAAKRLDRIVALQSEVSMLHVYEGVPDWRESIAAYEAAGFGLSGLFPVNRDEARRLIEADCVLVRAGRIHQT